MKKKLKLLMNYLPIITFVFSIISFSIAITSHFNAQYAVELTESWRDALSRSLEIISEGGKAHPYRAPDKWVVNFEQELDVEINFGVSASVVLIRGNSNLSQN